MADLSAPRRLVLGSASPRRRELLERLGLAVDVRPAQVDETPRPGESPEGLVERLAVAKARAVARPGELALGADTVVVLDREILGKPAGATEAAGMLRRLSGRDHQVLTGVAIVGADGEVWSVVESSTVRFATLSEREISWYLHSGEPFDKAGGYAVQGLAALFVEGVEGNFSNVVGLPLPATYRLLRQAGFDILEAGQKPRAGGP
jgi:septum formation protein